MSDKTENTTESKSKNSGEISGVMPEESEAEGISTQEVILKIANNLGMLGGGITLTVLEQIIAGNALLAAAAFAMGRDYLPLDWRSRLMDAAKELLKERDESKDGENEVQTK